MSQIRRTCTLGEVNLNFKVTEMFSPERVGIYAPRHKLEQGSAYDVKHGYDLSDKEVQKKVEKEIEEEDPLVLVGSPPCTKFFILMNLEMNQDLTPEQMQRFHREL